MIFDNGLLNKILFVLNLQTYFELNVLVDGLNYGYKKKKSQMIKFVFFYN